VGVWTAAPLAKTNIVSAGAALGGTAQLAIGSSSTDFQNTYFRIDNSGNDNFCIDQIVSGSSFNRLFIERITGNVGIGTSSPAAKLDVSGPASVTSFTGTTRLGVTVKGSTGATDYSGIDFSGNAQSTPLARIALLSTGAGAELRFGTSNSYGSGITNTAMTIDPSGNVLVGTTTGDARVTIRSSSINDNIGSLQVANTNTTADACVASFITATNSTATSNALVKFVINDGASGSGQINANGASQAAFGGFSDRRLKENIVDLPSQLESIMALRPVEFDYIESEGGGHQIGFVAQEIQEVYSDAVGERSDGMLTVTGWNKTEARLVAAIQEQQALITQLQADVAALQGAA
jgi:hypothetical protein